MGHIFISHSSADGELTRAVAEGLRSRKIESQFLDFSSVTGIPAVADWEQELYRRLWGCSALLALVTDHYLDSRWCFAELCLARMRGKRVVALLADPLKPNAVIPPQLSVLQRVDAREDLSRALDALVEGLELAGLAEEARFALLRSRCPYPGLNAFEAEDAGVFFGRDEEIRRLDEHLRRVVPPGAPRSLLVVGGSGVGKSSLIRAGLLPRRGGDWNILGPFRPGAHPLQQLAFSIEELTGGSALEIDGRLRAPDVSLALLLRSALPKDRRTLPVLVVIDQLEELLPAPPDSAAAHLAELVIGAVSEPHGSIHVLGTLRTTDLDALLAHPILRGLGYHRPFTLAPIKGDALRQIITGPADKAGLRFDEGLPGRILSDMSRSGALPLLAYTLRRLWEYGHRDNLLSAEEYTAIGGLEGAIASAAEDCIPAAEAQEEALRRGLLRLVRVGLGGEFSSRAVPWADLSNEEREALAPLLAHHLLARDLAGEGGVDTVRVAHEALFRAWNRFSRWIEENREELIVAQQLERAVALWTGADRQVADLWRGARLHRTRELVEARRLLPSVTELEFLAAATASEEAERAKEIEQQAALARSARAALSRGLALQAQVETNPVRALLLAHASAQIQVQAGEPMGAASERALRDVLAETGGRVRYQKPAGVHRLWPHNRLAAVLAQYEDGSLVWVPPADARSPCVPLADPPPDIEQVSFGADGTLTVLTANGLVHRWSEIASEATAPRVLTPPDHSSAVNALAPDGTWLAVGGSDGVYFTPLTGPVEHWRLIPTDRAVQCVRASMDSRWIVAGDESGTLTRILVDDAELLSMSWSAHEAPIHDIALSADASVIVSAAADKTLRRFEPGSKQIEKVELLEPAERILCLEVSRDGSLVALGSWFSLGQIWSAIDGFSQAHTFRGLKSSYTTVSLYPSGSWLIAASPRDPVAHLWSESAILNGGDPILVRGPENYISTAAFLETGSFVTGDWSGVIREYTSTHEEPAILLTTAPDLNHASVDASVSGMLCAGHLFQVTVRDDDPPADTRAVWVDLYTGECRVFEEPDTAVAVVQSGDGQIRVVAGKDGEVHVYRGDARKRYQLPRDLQVLKLTLAPAGRWLLADCWGPTFLMDLSGDAEPLLLKVQEQNLGVAGFSTDGRTLIAATPSGELFRASLADDGPGPPVPWTRLSGQSAWLKELSDASHWAARTTDGVEVLDTWGNVCAHLPFEKTDSSGEGLVPELFAGRWLVHSGFGSLSRWDLLASNPAESEESFLGLEHTASQIAVSSDGGLLVAAETDGPVLLWRPAMSVTEPVILPHEHAMVMILAFREATAQLVTMDSNGVIRTWDLDLDRLCARARTVAGRDLTVEERLRFLGTD